MTKEFEIKLTPEEVAEFFNNMDSDEHARFFNAVAALVELQKYDFAYQMLTASRSSLSTPEGLQIMNEIGDCVE